MIFKVRKDTQIGKLVEAIKKEKDEIEIKVIGKEAGWRALKAVAIAGAGVMPLIEVQETANGEKISILTLKVIKGWKM